MDENPDQPADGSLKFDERQINDCIISSDGGHDTQVSINKWMAELLLIHQMLKILGQVLRLLYRDRGEHGMPLRRFLGDHLGDIPDGKNILITNDFIKLDPKLRRDEIHFQIQSRRWGFFRIKLG